MPLVTVYIPTKNRSSMLNRAIKSVVNQTHKDIEIVIVDDNSHDDTETVVSHHKTNINIKYIKLDKDCGACYCRNLAIMESKGDYLTGLDDDDYFSREDRIAKFIKYISNNEEKILYDSVIYEYNNNVYKKIKKKENVNSYDLEKRNYIGNQIFAKKEIFINSGLYDIDMPAWQDWDLWIRISKLGYSFYNINSFSYTVNKCNNIDRISTKDQNKIRIAKEKMISKYKLDDKQISYLNIAMLMYPHIKPNIGEIISVIRSATIKELYEIILQRKN